MPAQLSGLVDSLQKTVRQFTLAQRTLAILAVAVLALGAFGLAAWLTKPTMTPLFSGVSASDASAIVDKLAEDGVTYELSDGGSTILVPADAVYSERLAMASAGLPAASDGQGYSLLDSMGMTSSEFQQQVTYQRALVGELAKTIGAIAGVQAATVHLAMPDESVFVSETADPTASVFVQTAAGTSLGTDKVQSIVHLVSAGIDGMQPTDVAVIDADGTVLSAVGEGVTAGLADSKTAEYEERGFSLRAGYRPRAGDQLTLSLNRTHGEYPNRTATLAADRAYDQQDLRLDGRWQITSATRLAGYIGYTGRSYDFADNRDFDGMTGRVELDWAVTAKAAISAVVRREIGAQEDLVDNFVVTDSLLLRPRWSPTEKIALSTEFELRKRDYGGDPGLGGVVPSDRSEELRRFGVFANYQLRRTVSLGAGLRWENRSSDDERRDYSADSASLTARVAF